MPIAVRRPGGARAGGTAPTEGFSPYRPPKLRRRPSLVVAGVALGAAAALMVLWRIDAITEQEPVLVVLRAVPVGSVVQEADVGVASLPRTSQLAHVPAARRAEVVGRPASSDLVVGALVAPGQVGSVVPPAAGEVLTVIALPTSRLPSVGLRPGDSILIVSTPPAQADLPQTRPDSITARVVRVGAPDLNGLVPVDVVVAPGDGPEVAARAATGRIAVVLQPRSVG